MKEIPDTERMLANIEQGLRSMIDTAGLQQVLMIGIHTGGYRVAGMLHTRLALRSPLAGLDITFYRDDFSRIGMNPKVIPSDLPVDVDDRHIVLVDDVLHTGRTVRAAMNEIFDYGRPASINLVVLVERDRRELPIQADIAGARMELHPNEYLKLEDKKNLSLKKIRRTE